ncbi:hypothetical protein P3U62_08355 [Mammaliicoccus vitulinus]|uniref:hypothetical protein n=1 Tax=Mammaliicoccus vitulinus TaxID=71237 RepID=UPI002B257E9F|nr:hypothetical protein [Mammaliicoccus vitulinus]WQK87062.1 hypothetical protein P3U62_08355 [Mammaliicoccus vitulinus]
MKITEVKINSQTPKEMFEKDIEENKSLPLRTKRCKDCPATDMYLEISEELSKQEPDIQSEAAKRWFCHYTRNKSCRGIADYLSIKGDIDVKDNEIQTK